MISASQITFATLTAGPVLSIGFLGWYRYVIGKWGMPLSLFIGVFANGLSVVPLVCVIANIVHGSYLASFNPPDTLVTASVATTISGSETTIFLALVYAILMMFYAVHRTIAEQKKSEQPRSGEPGFVPSAPAQTTPSSGN